MCDLNKLFSVFEFFGFKWGDNNIIGIRDICKMLRMMFVIRKCLIIVVNRL